MSNDTSSDRFNLNISSLGSPPKLAHITATYIDMAERLAEHTRMSTNELAKIIANIHEANS